ncbi:hypothetical protein [Metamycoplasma alkalescens]|uniref:Uncharacterized protein n=1 Tax=Metamycoplasma alkalescens TaxID=45363 RepID=A0A318U942_9BACT|nr:hypothetical protein [Metamycoplasma alkalescens]PYF42635.1 hypothetical protein BCF88_1079 [Metamycoplasma alkalescens]SYV90788.1 Uncharacterised protein [Metamycoplasma alkalescens]
MDNNIQIKNKKIHKISFLQFAAGCIFLITLTGFISVMLATFFKDKAITNPFYLSVIAFFGLSCLFLVINSIFGIKIALKNNNKKLLILFVLSAILILPFVSIYTTFASATLMLEYKQ